MVAELIAGMEGMLGDISSYTRLPLPLLGTKNVQPDASCLSKLFNHYFLEAGA